MTCTDTEKVFLYRSRLGAKMYDQNGEYKAYYLLKEGNHYELSVTPKALLYKDLLTGHINEIPYETVRD